MLSTITTAMALMLYVVAAFAQGGRPMDQGPTEGIFNVRGFGAKADGATDDTAALQCAIDKAAQQGGQVYLPPGRYFVSGSLWVKPGVAVVGAAVAPQYIKPLIGTVILATGGRDQEEAPALFELGDSSAVQGLTVYYPDQKPDDIHPYNWTFHLQGGDNTVENVTLINSYNAVRVGPEPNVRHRIRSVSGCALRNGIFVDSCSDIGRVENVQFHCHWWSAPEVGGNWDRVYEYMWRNCEAFTFARTDWEYITNNFVFPVKIGYHFIATQSGACNGHLTANGADAAQVCVQVDEIQPMGLLITNGQFVAFSGDDPTAILVGEKCRGQVRLVNCNFWGAFRRIAVLKGNSFVGFSDCYLSNWDAKSEGLPAIDQQAGKLQVQGCSFLGKLAVRIDAKAKHAIILGNNGSHGVRVEDHSKGKAILRDNEAAPHMPPASRHYTLSIGSEEDEECLTGGWYGGEVATDGPPGTKSARWTRTKCGLRLPVLPDTDYELLIWVSVVKSDPANRISLSGGGTVKVDKPGLQQIRLVVPKAITAGGSLIEITFTAKTWVPKTDLPPSTDTRELGMRVFSVVMKAR
ncbi:MAG: hypothetical protein HY318_16075 [Armatimonadetes bacterium]|nr:hypothetical protein [Armatimonadota bacterium]